MTTTIDSTTPSATERDSGWLARLADDAYRELSLAHDCAASNRALLAVLDQAVEAIRRGGFAKITQELEDVAAQLRAHTDRTVNTVADAAAALAKLTGEVAATEAGLDRTAALVGGIRTAAREIVGVAAQSNLLSLNARVEASRAGEAGAGFTVVAAEMGALSKRAHAISEHISGELAELCGALEQSLERARASRAGLGEAETAVQQLQSTARGIDGEAARLAGVSHSVGRIAEAQILAQEQLEATQRHGEWVRDAAATLVCGLERAAEQVDLELRDRSPVAERGRPSTLRAVERAFFQSLTGRQADLARTSLERALADGLAPERLLQRVAAAAARAYRGRDGADVPLETVYRNSHVLEHAVATLEPRIGAAAAAERDVVVLGNAFEDYHDLGRRLVAMGLRAAGFRVIDLGLGVKNDAFVAAIREHAARVVGVSALLLHTAKWIPRLKEDLARAGLGHVKVIAGGAIFHVDPRLRERFGADGVGRNPDDAVRLVRAFMAEGAQAAAAGRPAGGRR